ncbi:hypothetical protein EDD17DRAFT_1506422 [Pisolithus thermaeus]|nr:hypothetical protein EV401DRAFT_2196562 [Pisolithus croceorrhizus]KAI6164397.1 hypothetical protein EDD17DRAFT_1506422 [Pisolithus thermaeus]
MNNEVQSVGTATGTPSPLTPHAIPFDQGMYLQIVAFYIHSKSYIVVRSEACTVEIPDSELQLPPACGQHTTVEGLLRDIAVDLGSDQPMRRILDEAGYTRIQQIVGGIKEVLGDGEEVEDEADEMRQVSSVTEKKQRRLRSLPLEEPSTEQEGASEEKTEVDSEGAGDTNEEIYEFTGTTNAEKPFTLFLDDPLPNSYLQNLYVPDPDPNMEIVTYERTWQQTEELGLNDMRVENNIAEDVDEPKEEKRFEELAS